MILSLKKILLFSMLDNQLIAIFYMIFHKTAKVEKPPFLPFVGMTKASVYHNLLDLKIEKSNLHINDFQKVKNYSKIFKDAGNDYHVYEYIL